MVTDRELSHEELLVALLQTAGCNTNWLADRIEARQAQGKKGRFQELLEELFSRLKSDEPPKTEETTYGALVKDDEFLDREGNRNLVVGHSGSIVALPLEGPSKHILWWPGAVYPVRKVIK